MLPKMATAKKKFVKFVFVKKAFLIVKISSHWRFVWLKTCSVDGPTAGVD
jgi:hypothetical protein